MKHALLFASLVSSAFATGLVPSQLRCEYHASPLAIGTTAPRFSWKLSPSTPAARDIQQSAYEIQVARESDGFEKTPLWSSGKIASAATDQIKYAGDPLVSRDRAIWRVRVWDGAGVASEWSQPTSFGVGLLGQADWSALWISSKEDHSFTTTENVQNFHRRPDPREIGAYSREVFPQGVRKPRHRPGHRSCDGAGSLHIGSEWKARFR
ncbi:MAG: hypothetical protein HC767_04085 [Akkermansiaceae bacterium]|nr:hypothetical protein [Akkermansiaceae bacterium]